MPYDSIIFDIDGTLWRTDNIVARGWNDALKSLGVDIQLTSEDHARTMGKPFDVCVDILLPGLIEKHPNLHKILNNHEIEAIRRVGPHFYDGVLSGIQKLSAHYPLYLLSNCAEPYLHLFRDISGLNNYFKAYDCFGMSKVPKWEMISNMKSKYSLKNPVYIGDTAGDEKATQKAGVDFFFVEYGFGEAENPLKRFETFNELVGYFLNK